MRKRRSPTIDPNYGCAQILASIVKAPRFYFTTIMEWNDDIAYALTPLKLISFPLGFWPLQENNMFDLLRYIVSVVGLVRFHLLSCECTGKFSFRFSFSDISSRMNESPVERDLSRSVGSFIIASLYRHAKNI